MVVGDRDETALRRDALQLLRRDLVPDAHLLEHAGREFGAEGFVELVVDAVHFLELQEPVGGRGDPPAQPALDSQEFLKFVHLQDGGFGHRFGFSNLLFHHSIIKGSNFPRNNLIFVPAMQHLGEIISLMVAVFWTVTAIFADKASHRIGSMSTNILRLAMASVFLAILLWVTLGHPYPLYADGKAWLWLGLSALVGYVFGDWCLFNSYLVIGARFGQLFMTLAPPMAAIAGWAMLGETLTWKSMLAMAVTLSGIAISILSKGEGHTVKLSLPLKGVLLGLGAGAGQGVGLVLSKIGMQHYEAAVPAGAPELMGTMLPFASTMIRALIGCAGFLALMALQKDLPRLKAAFHDRKGLAYVAILTLFGPALGVSLSLMAVQYTDAGIASTLMALTPVLIILPYSLMYKQKVRLKEIIGVTVSMVGVAMFFLM